MDITRDDGIYETSFCVSIAQFLIDTLQFFGLFAKSLSTLNVSTWFNIIRLTTTTSQKKEKCIIGK